MTLAEQADQSAFHIQARLALGMANYWKGDRVQALEEFAAGSGTDVSPTTRGFMDKFREFFD